MRSAGQLLPLLLCPTPFTTRRKDELCRQLHLGKPKAAGAQQTLHDTISSLSLRRMVFPSHGKRTYSPRNNAAEWLESQESCSRFIELVPQEERQTF